MSTKLPLKYIIPTKKRLTTFSGLVFDLESGVGESLLGILIVVVMVIMTFHFLGQPLDSIKTIVSIPHYPLLFGLLASGAISLFVGVGFSTKKSAKDNEFKIVECSDNGIRLGAGKFDIQRTIFISWNHVNYVEAVEDQSPRSHKEHYLLISTINEQIYQLRWENAFAWTDEESFFSTLKGCASHAKLNFELDEVGKKDQLDTRYTNLWLHYFSAPTNRQRKGRLEAGVILQDGAYEIIDKLSGGGQGMTYVANCLKNDDVYNGVDRVVLKEYVLPVYRGNKLESENYAVLSREAEILASLTHNQIVKLYDCFVEDHRGYLVMEYIEGRSLSQIVKELGVLSDAQVADIAFSVSGILEYLHNREKPVIHRDLTPDNLILCDDTALVKLLDFTVAQESFGNRTATIVGKQSYMPPEQFRGEPCPQSDIYALGCTMYYLLTGIEPKPMELDSPRMIRPEIDQGLDQIVVKAGQFELIDRYKTASEMGQDLRAWLHKTGSI